MGSPKAARLEDTGTTNENANNNAIALDLAYVDMCRSQISGLGASGGRSCFVEGVRSSERGQGHAVPARLPFYKRTRVEYGALDTVILGI